MAEDEMVGWHHQLNGHEFEQHHQESPMPQGVAKKKKIERENKRFNKKRNRKTKLSVVLYLGSLSIFFTPFLPNSKLSGPDLPESRF